METLGLVGNVITFIDFSWNLISGAHEIYKSTSDTSENSHTLKLLATNVAQLSDAIITDTGTPENLRSLSTECRILAKDLLGIIKKLEANTKHKRWDSFIAALKEVWNQKKVDSLVVRLQQLHGQVMAHIQFTVMNQQSLVVRELAKIDRTSKRLDMENNQVIFELKCDILGEMKKLHSSQKPLENAAEQIRELKEVDPVMIEELSKSLQNLSKSMVQLKEQSKATVMDQEFLRSLYFERLMARHDRIETAHSQTYEWIFKDSQTNHQAPRRFVEWLRSEHGLFWIQGKAGSGKSTLMKFLRNHKLTTQHLQSWAGKDRLARASYFFWAAGSDLQKSQEGLLRTFLFEILRSCPELIQRIRESSSDIEYWAISNERVMWSLTSLKRMCFIIREHVIPAKFCFFIDGLDEYKDNTRELIELVRAFAGYPHIKICVSSRPWAEFKHSFGHDTPWQIKLEDLTAEDIRQYVYDHLNQDKQFNRLKKDNVGYEKLASEVVQRAQGVFLWVFLVVRSLLEGACYADSIEQMQNRLEDFPKDLEDFFKHMLNDVPPPYRSQSPRTFKIASTALGPLPLVIYGFVEDIYKQPNFALDTEVSRFPENELLQRIDRLPRQLDAQCKGLLEVVRISHAKSLYHTYEVDFLHRTVRDFLKESEEVRELFQQDAADGFNPSLTLCHAYLINLKHAWSMKLWGTDDPVSEEGIEQIFNYAKQAQEELADTSPIDLIIDATENSLIAQKNNLRVAKIQRDDALLVKALEFGLYDYVDRKISDGKMGSIPIPMGRPLLSHLLESNVINPAVVAFALSRGANPNQKYERGTHWTNFLRRCLDKSTSFAQKDPTREVIRLLIKYNADLDSIVPVSRKKVNTSVAATAKKATKESRKARNVLASLYPSNYEQLLSQAPPRSSLRRITLFLQRLTSC
ncbi:hypothetical protein F4805DRAFT_420067 [Annulohypoxylon moriforme]|nr:hypothetical protein F4805DRAFT_420067 [Annulohypoxylon moriforme]